ncbi:MAG TPA: MFS transporter [Burkholderiales bacterium]|nr:MFS transporter [Burkholderiales bacterium]
MAPFLCRALRAERHELPALAWSFAYFFTLLAGYYVLRPVRDEMGVQAGTGALPWLFSATFVAMLLLVPLYGWLCARLPRARLLPAVYAFFALNLAGFWAALRAGVPVAALAPVFFVWLSVYNLFVVSVFWSYMADLFDTRQAARLFGAIAAGGSAGAIAGPALTALAAAALGTPGLLLVSAALLCASMACIAVLARWSRAHPRAGEPPPEAPLGGSALAGVRAVLASPFLLGICGYLLCYAMLFTTLYFQQTAIFGAEIPDPRERLRLFATLDLTANSLALLLQLFVFAPLGALLGVAWMLALMPLLAIAGFAWLGAAPGLGALVTLVVSTRIVEFALSKPVRESLYTAVPREARYKAKSFIDTVVYRGGDAASGWMFGALQGAGLGLAAIAFAMLPLALAWLGLAFFLGSRMRRWMRASDARSAPSPALP